MTFASGMRVRRSRIPTALEDGGTGSRTREEAVAALGVPSLSADNTFTGDNTFNDLMTVTTGSVYLGSNANVLDGSAAFGPFAWDLPAASGTLALLSDITGGSGNGVVATVDFGSSFTPYASVVVTGQAWVASGSKIVATPKASTGTEVEVAVMAFSCVVSDLVAGVGFTLNVFTPVEAKGTYNFSCVGV